MSYVIFFKALILPLGEPAGLLEAGLQPESSGEILSDSATVFFPAASWAENNSFAASWLLGLVSNFEKEIPTSALSVSGIVNGLYLEWFMSLT